ncbi:DEAD/DEAH box helicase [Micromonospora haikouensis]|uniref:DEAD/DEAH box helicase n=1 Tax=Micromonospora haikouensis TaxID=686309 RepID=UPI0036BB76A8
MQQYLRLDPLYAARFSDVWLWSEWPDNGGQSDTGIDLVARERDGQGYCAIQCKFYEPHHYLQKTDIDSFFTASGKAPFTSRIIVSTTDRWGKHAEAALTDQRTPVTRLGLPDIAASPIDWDLAWPRPGQEPRLELLPGKHLRPHQSEAIEAVVRGFAAHDRGKLIMACGTGKTFTALRLAERHARQKTDGSTTSVLFLVPSISLLSQTLREWTAQTSMPLRAFAVCSDPRVSRRGDGAEDISAHDLALPATTDPGRLVAQARAGEALSGPALNVVFSTYQSITTVSAAQKAGLPDFDLIICDEAHRTTGVTLAGRDESQFVKVHDNDVIRGAKRLYMTATPRLFDDTTKTTANQNDAVLCSMDDEKLFGPEFHRLGFGKAVSDGLLTDYKVLILTVDEKHLARSLQSQIADDNSEINLDDAVKIVGCWNGLAKRSGSTGDGSGFALGEAPMRRAVAFSRSIAESQKLTASFAEVIGSYDRTDEDVLRCEVHHVDGGMNALRRNAELDWLKADLAPNECRILSNARCLSEGVDIPALDAVLFLNPRNSVVDVVQSVGRVMRRADDKDYGYIILPVGIPSDMAPEKALADNKRYRVVWQVLQALRAHDDRFNATINKIDLNARKPKNIMVGMVGFDGDSETATTGDSKTSQTAETKAAQQLMLDVSVAQWRDAIYAKIVTKVGERTYWENWAKDIAAIAGRHVDRIKVLVDDPASGKAEAFDQFLAELRANINPGVTRDAAIDMLAQHLITKPVFDALFQGYEFSTKNPVSITMQKMLDILGDQALGKESETLESFYASVRLRAEGIDNHEGRQKVITELYERFFKTALPKTAEAFGIVYTPIPVVDFILRVTDQALRRHLGTSLSAPGVQIIDPFTGTGTFVVHLLQSGLIQPEDLLRKYTQELHANEIVLLAYYIAAVNIEAAFHQLRSDTYTPFDGIVWTDTFQLAETGGNLDAQMFPENSQRVQRQKAQDIRVVIGNPPYSSGQSSQNDGNENQRYPALDARISKTYAAKSTATNKNSLYDSYIRAIRWASDRIGDEGVICFVSNGGYIDGNSAGGLRLSLAEEFSAVYCLNLRGRQSGDWRAEGGKIFGSGSKTAVAILLLVKERGSAGSRHVNYFAVADGLTREEKLELLSSSSLDTVDWQAIPTSPEGDWINQRSSLFAKFVPLGAKASASRTPPRTIFALYSAGLQTNRDSWVYNHSSRELVANTQRMIASYNDQVRDFVDYCTSHRISDFKGHVDEFIDRDPTRISWSRSLKARLAQRAEVEFNGEAIMVGLYRPFNKQHVYFDRHLNHERSQLPRMFPTPRHPNIGFYCVGTGSDKPFSVLMTDQIPDLALWGSSNGQFFPRYTYRVADDLLGQLEDDGFQRVDNVTDATLARYREFYGGEVSKDDIFFYAYGILHSPTYRARFESDLKKLLPRLPMVKTFHRFADAGRKLAELHVGYESVEPYELQERLTSPAGIKPADVYRVEKMTFGRGKDRSQIAYNAYLTVSGIPEAAYRYTLGARSAIEWIIKQYQVTINNDSKIRNDPNDWSSDPRYILDLLKRVVTVSIETMKIVDSLPEFEVAS